MYKDLNVLCADATADAVDAAVVYSCLHLCECVCVCVCLYVFTCTVCIYLRLTKNKSSIMNCKTFICGCYFFSDTLYAFESRGNKFIASICRSNCYANKHYYSLLNRNYFWLILRAFVLVYVKQTKVFLFGPKSIYDSKKRFMKINFALLIK